MSSYFDDASLVMIPSGYKTSKVYSVKPTDGSGDLTFTRSNSTASRVASNGLIEKVRTNLFLQSNGFDTASWSKSGATVTANQPDPFGGNNAFLVKFSGATTDSVGQLVSMVSGTPYTLSVWIKGVDLTALRVAIGANLVIVTSQVINGTWVRVSATQTAGSTGSLTNQIRAGNSLGESFYIYAAQLETGDIATQPILTTTAAVSVGPVANVPRLDYLNSSCPRLLLEPQRTNLIRFSESFNDSAWSKTNVSVTANTTISPDGYTNADTITGNGALSVHDIWQGFAGGGTSNSVSFFVKKGTSRYVYLSTSYQATTSDYATILVDLDTQSVVNSSSGAVSFVSSSVVNYGNGWYRITSNTTAASATNLFTFVGISSTFTFNLSLYGRQVSATDQTAIFYGIQAEVGAYATSYIPTLGAAVTRGADACSKTGISSLIGQTEGTLFADITLTSRSNFSYFAIAPNLGSTSAYIGIGITLSAISFEVVNSGVQVAYNFPNTSTGRLKLAFAYKANDFVAYVNGALVHTDTSGTVPTCSQIGLNAFSNTASWNYNQALLFKTRLTNAQLAELTTI